MAHAVLKTDASRKVCTRLIEAGVDAAKEMILGNVIFEIEGVEQPLLPTYLLPHHGRDP